MNELKQERTFFRQAVQAYKEGDRLTARKYMSQALLEDPNHVAAWLWMSGLVDDEDKQRECLQRALAIDPQCEPAQRGLDMLRLKEVSDKKVQDEVDSPETVDMDDVGQRQAGRLGDYLVDQGLISRKQLEIALHEQRLFWKSRQGVRAPLGDILIHYGMINAQDLATALVTQQHDRLHGREKQSPGYIGEHLVARGIITREQFEAVLAEQLQLKQRGTSLLIGELLVHAGYVTREVLDRILEEQQKEIFKRFGFDD